VKLLRRLYWKYRDVLLYLIFGVLTTVINILSYHLCYQIFAIDNVISTVIAWVVAVVFAFVTNKLFVFESTAKKGKAIIEAVNFFACRIGTGVIEVGVMYLFVDVFAFNGTVMKLITNVIVIIINYIASKLLVFKKKGGDKSCSLKKE
jgi:putative flippase GtrA